MSHVTLQHTSTHCNTQALDKFNGGKNIYGEDLDEKMNQVQLLQLTLMQQEPELQVCCSLLQSVAVCCSLLQSVAVYCSLLQSAEVYTLFPYVCCSALQCVAEGCSVLQCIVCFHMSVTVCCRVLQSVAMLQCGVVRRSVLQSLMQPEPELQVY